MALLDAVLALHVVTGFAALAAAFTAFAAKTLDLAHRWHIRAGRVFLPNVGLVVLTALPLAIAASDVFLLLIAVFTAYLASSGWRYATRRHRAPGTLDRTLAVAMIAVAIAMLLFGAAIMLGGDGKGIALALFGLIGGSLAIADLRFARQEALRSEPRIGAHLTRMLSATIATLTAFLVTSFTMEPAVLLWLAPTILMTPVIVWWNRRLRRGVKPRGMPREPQHGRVPG